jgi:hypothetical protein
MDWPLDLPAREALRLPGETAIAWAVFDAAWYRARYREAAAQCPADDPSATLAWYLRFGQRLGHSPNRLFDERWHRQAYPAIAEKVAAGEFASAFDAYCRRGALDRSAHWLFGELAYRDRYQDLTNAVLAAAEVANGYDHYLRHGVEEDRTGHLLFDPAAYLANFDPQDAAAIRAGGVFPHFLARIESGAPELATSRYFDPVWYRLRYPEVEAAIQAGTWKCALHHYLCNDRPTAFDPSPHFSEAFYLSRDPGLLGFIERRDFRNGYDHFLQFGVREKRPPAPHVNLAWYAGQPAVRRALEDGAAPDAFAHWLAIGQAAARADIRPAPPLARSAEHAREIAGRAAVAQVRLAGRFGYSFVCSSPPALSVVMAVRNGFAATMAAIASLRGNTAIDIELIVADRGSTDETRALARYVPGVTLLPFDSEGTWAQAMDAGRQLATAPLVLFLSPETRLGPGAVARAMDRFAADTTTGAVGGMIVDAGGAIAQAGGILWRDGGVHDYQRGASPLAPEANFLRQVDFCSPVFLLLRADLLNYLNGFDRACAEGYETVDLCLRAPPTGLRVLYDPAVLVFYDGEDVRPSGAGPHFLEKHAELLSQRHEAGGPVQLQARHTGRTPRRLLFIEDTVPLRRTGSGFVRSNDILRVMARLGIAVTVYPMLGCDHDPAQVFGDMPDTAEVMHNRDASGLKAFLTARAGYYDTVWVARAHNLARVRPFLEDSRIAARIILDTEALEPRRLSERARLEGAEYDFEAAMAELAATADICAAVAAVTDAELVLLGGRGLNMLMTIGHMIVPRPTPAPFARRSGMLFVGAVHKADSPNMDSLVWFVDHVLPLVEAELGWQTRLTIAGYVAPGVDMSRFEGHPRVTLRGEVADLQPLYNSHRVFIAPTRYAAGVPYKVLEAAAFGLPVVATDLLAAELGWTSGQQILAVPVGDAAGFAASVVALHRDEAAWDRQRQAALARLESDHGEAGFEAAVAGILGVARPR